MKRVRLITAASPVRWLFMVAVASLAYLDLQFLLLKPPANDASPRTGQEPASETQGEADTLILAAAQITLALRDLADSFPLPDPSEEQMGQRGFEWTHRRYELALQRPRNFEQFIAPFLAIAERVPRASVAVQEEPEFTELKYGVGGLITHTVRFHWIVGPPRLCLIVTGLGADLFAARALVSLAPLPSFAVDPLAPFADLVSERLAAASAEVLLDWVYPEPQAPSGDASELHEPAAALAAALERLPRVSGIVLRASSDPLPPPPETSFLARLRGRAPHLVVVPPNWANEVCRRAAQLGIGCIGAEAPPAELSPDGVQIRLAAARMLARQRGDQTILLPAAGSSAILQDELARLAESGMQLVRLSEMLGDAQAAPAPSRTPSSSAARAED